MNGHPNPLHLSPHARAVGLWLLVVAAMVGAMTVLGGVTRLTESGLSMVEWRPLIGALPPFSDGEWARVFALYQTSPEYQKINSGMSLADFKQIFWWEYIHRFWGRLIGLPHGILLDQRRDSQRPASQNDFAIGPWWQPRRYWLVDGEIWPGRQA